MAATAKKAGYLLGLPAALGRHGDGEAETAGATRTYFSRKRTARKQRTETAGTAIAVLPCAESAGDCKHSGKAITVIKRATTKSNRQPSAEGNHAILAISNTSRLSLQ